MKTLHFPSKSALNWSGITTKMENNNTEAVQCLLYLSNYFGFFTRFSFSSYKKVTFIRLQMQEQWIIYKCCWCVFACLLGAWVCLHPRTKQCPAPSTNNDISVNPLLPSPFLQTHNRTVCRSVPWPTALHTSTSRLPRVLIDTMGFSGWQSTDVPRTFTNPLIQNHSWWTTQCSIT